MTSTAVFTCICCGSGVRISGIKDAAVSTNHHGQLYEIKDSRGNQPSLVLELVLLVVVVLSSQPWQRACCILIGSVRILNVQQAFLNYNSINEEFYYYTYIHLCGMSLILFFFITAAN